MSRRNPRESIAAAQSWASVCGFTATEQGGLDFDGALTLCIEGYGQWIEVYFRPSPTGYWRYWRTFVHDNHGDGDRWQSWKRTKELMSYWHSLTDAEGVLHDHYNAAFRDPS